MSGKGVSLLELLVVITVAAVAGGILINVMVSSNKLFFDQSAQISQGLSLNQTVLELTELIKSSAGIAAQYPPEGTPLYTTDSNTLVVKLPSLTENGDVIESVYDFAVVEQDNGGAVLRKQVFADSLSFRNNENQVLSTSVKSLSFSFLDTVNNPITPILASRVNFAIKLSTKSGFSEEESSGSGTVNIKN